MELVAVWIDDECRAGIDTPSRDERRQINPKSQLVHVREAAACPCNGCQQRDSCTDECKAFRKYVGRSTRY